MNGVGSGVTITSSINQHHHGDDEDAVSVISTTCSSVDGDDQHSVMTDRSQRSGSKKRAIWKDKGGQARYTLHDENRKHNDKDGKPGIKPKNAVAAAAVTAGVVTGGVVGAVLLGPVGLVVGGVGGVGSAASALVTQRRLAFQRRRQRAQEERQDAQRSTSPVPEPPCRSFSGHTDASLVHDTKASF
ncbi:expressed unknown protein [Seminavis robusta]|uniref:Uncharacterized protein n=1 Tax=Seminavis robusta TaxID=568900 RepID=A0A9N8H546_9STRA|nr:expressed unknown protein [Seminavis robusta]|eukprot:Sro77_g042080.1 n/a (187) ;mRNA; f:67246-67806